MPDAAPSGRRPDTAPERRAVPDARARSPQTRHHRSALHQAHPDAKPDSLPDGNANPGAGAPNQRNAGTGHPGTLRRDPSAEPIAKPKITKKNG